MQPGNTLNNIEISQIDRRYENLRQKNAFQEKKILNSIIDRGQMDPILCVIDNKIKESPYIILDGFKRLRSLLKLEKSTIDIIQISENMADGILKLIRQSKEGALKIFEEAGFIQELKIMARMNNVDIAVAIGRSPAWVCLRQRLLEEMSEFIREEIINGRFPARAYLYTLKKFTRVNNISKKKLNEFVQSVSGKGYSVREIHVLAQAYFEGSDEMRMQIKNGDPDYTLNKIKSINGVPSNEQSKLSTKEYNIISNLEIIYKNIVTIQLYFRKNRTALHGGINSIYNTYLLFFHCRYIASNSTKDVCATFAPESSRYLIM